MESDIEEQHVQPLAFIGRVLSRFVIFPHSYELDSLLVVFTCTV